MGFPFSAPASALACLIFANALAADPVPPKGSMLLLHYRWRHDSLTLVESSRVPAAVKTSRLPAEKRSGESAFGPDARPYGGAPTGFSFELLDADGKRISGRFLPDPATRRVEYQEKGGHALRSQEERVDSADIFLRIPEADARTIRFHRHRGPGGAGSAAGVPMPGPEPAPDRSLIAEFALLALPPAMPLFAQTPEFMVVKETGPRDKRINIVILGDGYIASEKARFLAHLKTVADVVAKDPPLSGYADYFNIYGIFVASNQSGADNPAQGIARDTYFGASYSGRLLTIDNSKAFAVINGYLPESDMQFVVVNDGTYGGSGGQVAVADYANPEIIAHEAQHTFSGLGDEYDYAGVSPWESPNTTMQTDRASIRWAHWIAESTPVPTPETEAWSNAPGLFEGAAYNAIGWYRPKLNCRMRENGIPFCEVCSETILLSLYERVSPIDSAFPKPGAVAVAMNEIPYLRIKPKPLPRHALAIDWIVDGEAVPAITGDRFTQVLAPGSHTVSVIVKDTTQVVRLDPNGLLSDTVAWQVAVSGTTSLAGPGAMMDPDFAGSSGLAGSAGAAEFIKADAKQAWFNIKGAGPTALRLLSIDGRMLERHPIPAGAGLIRIAWSRPLAPGLYVSETARNGRISRLRFPVLP